MPGGSAAHDAPPAAADGRRSRAGLPAAAPPPPHPPPQAATGDARRQGLNCVFALRPAASPQDYGRSKEQLLVLLKDSGVTWNNCVQQAEQAQSTLSSGSMWFGTQFTFHPSSPFCYLTC